MESIDESIENSQEKVEPLHLFENSWFFNNLFITNKRRTPQPQPPIIPRCFSDPCPSFSNHHQQPEILPLPLLPPEADTSMEEAFLAIKKLPSSTTEPAGGGGGRFSRPAGLTRAPSLPEESAPQRVRKSNLQRSFSPNNNNFNNQIARAPSLPASMMIRDEIQDDESDFSMSRLIRQASLHHSDLLPPRSKGVVATRSPSTPKQRQRTKPADIENSSTTKSSSSGGVSHSVGGGGGGGGGGVRRQQQQQQQHQHHQGQGLSNRTRLARSTSDMGFQELVGFRELNYIEKNEEEQQPWQVENNNSSSQTTQQEQRITEQWAADKRRSVEDDMKAQIKFWARTVASNVK